MNKIVRNIFLLMATIVTITACEKAEPLPFYEGGKDIALTTSTATPPNSVADSVNNVVTLSWSNPEFATDTSNYKYVVEVAPAGTNFAHPATYTVMTTRNFALTGNQLNNLLVAWGSDYGESQELEARVKASYANNNDMKISNTVKFSAAPVAKPFTVSASATGPFAPTAFTKDDKFTALSWTAPQYGDTSSISYTIQSVKAGASFDDPYEITVGAPVMHELTGMELYSMALAAGLPLEKEGAVDVRIKATVNNTNQVSYSTDKVTLKIKPVEMILYLHVAGDFQGWNPGGAPRIASNDGINYEGYVWVPAGGNGEFKFTSQPDWNGTNYGGTSGTTGGTIDGSNSNNLQWPATGKYYLLKVNMTTKTWTVTETTWGLIGDATPGGWDNSTPMTYNPTTNKWTATVAFGNGSWKFRANNGWDINIGGANPLSYGGDNIASPGGTKTVTLDLSNPLKYTYTIQ